MSEEQNTQTKRSGAFWAVVVAGVVLAGFSVLFLIEFADLAAPEDRGLVDDEAGISQEDPYQDIVEPLIANANPVRGEELVVRYGCSSCHVTGVDNNLGPSFDGLASRAADQHPPLSAESYIYEAIIYPAAHEVEGNYTGLMPRNYEETINETDLGDIIAYLLTLES